MQIFHRLGGAVLLAILAVSTAACGTMSTPGYNPEPMAVIGVVQNPDFNNGVVPPEAYDQINRYAASCYQQLEGQARGRFESGIRGAIDNGVAGTIGGAIGLSTGSRAFEGVDPGSYGVYGAAAGGAQGAAGGYVNGQISGSYAMATARAACTDDFWSDRPSDLFRGTHVVPLTNGRSSFGDRPQHGPYRRE